MACLVRVNSPAVHRALASNPMMAVTITGHPIDMDVDSAGYGMAESVRPARSAIWMSDRLATEWRGVVIGRAVTGSDSIAGYISRLFTSLSALMPGYFDALPVNQGGAVTGLFTHDGSAVEPGT
jgi:hypothetical protein